MADEMPPSENLPDGDYIVLGSDPGAGSTASFRLTSETLDPDAVSRVTGVSPSLAYRKGDRRQFEGGREGAPHRFGMWSLDSSDALPETATLDEHLTWLLDHLEPSAADLADLLGAGARGDFFCGYFMTEWNAGWTLQPVTLARIGHLGVELGVDIYGPTEPDALRRIRYGKTTDPLFDILLDIVIDALAWLEAVDDETLDDRVAIKRMEWITHQLVRLPAEQRQKLSEILARRLSHADDYERETIRELIEHQLGDEDAG